MNIIGSVPFKTRVPLAAWAFAGLLTLLSIFSSLVHVVAGPESKQVTTSAKEAQHASMNW